MPVHTHWRVMFDANTEHKARRVLERLTKALDESPLDVHLDKRPDSGYRALFDIDHGDLTQEVQSRVKTTTVRDRTTRRREVKSEMPCPDALDSIDPDACTM